VDFNSTLCPLDSVGGADLQGHRDMERFHDLLSQGNLHDMGFQGDRLTWRKEELGVKLDRCLINMNCRLKLQEATLDMGFQGASRVIKI